MWLKFSDFHNKFCNKCNIQLKYQTQSYVIYVLICFKIISKLYKLNKYKIYIYGYFSYIFFRPYNSKNPW